MEVLRTWAETLAAICAVLAAVWAIVKSGFTTFHERIMARPWAVAICAAFPTAIITTVAVAILLPAKEGNLRFFLAEVDVRGGDVFQSEEISKTAVDEGNSRAVYRITFKKGVPTAGCVHLVTPRFDEKSGEPDGGDTHPFVQVQGHDAGVLMDSKFQHGFGLLTVCPPSANH